MRKIIQAPNAIISVAIIASLVHHFVSGRWGTAAGALALIAWSAWSYDELAHGTNNFRRLLGAVVMGGLVYRAISPILF